MSLTVISPRNWKSSLTTSTFSMRLLCSSLSTSSEAAPSFTVTSRSFLVMMWRTGSSSSVSKRMSRWVTMPASWPSASTTGTPEMLCAWVSASTSRMLVSGVTVNGSRITPDSNFLTLATCAACCATVMFLWMMPMPPSWAMAMAKRASVTVSIAAETIGSLSRRSRVRRVSSETSLGRTVEWAGTSETSSYVRASAWMRSMGGPDGNEARHFTLKCRGSADRPASETGSVLAIHRQARSGGLQPGRDGRRRAVRHREALAPRPCAWLHRHRKASSARRRPAPCLRLPGRADAIRCFQALHALDHGQKLPGRHGRAARNPCRA